MLGPIMNIGRSMSTA